MISFNRVRDGPIIHSIHPLLLSVDARVMLCYVRLLALCILGCVSVVHWVGKWGYTYLLRGQAHWLDGRKMRETHIPTTYQLGQPPFFFSDHLSFYCFSHLHVSLVGWIGWFRVGRYIPSCTLWAVDGCWELMAACRWWSDQTGGWEGISIY